ncbi:DUF4468 domain-containing protein [Elizabethkingia bruuniana]|uniref:DUF4468 domain-containing protein n=1 Tax=Elizabethkingia bruuniana TaxID=1756149 RepID=A0A7T7UWH1_9FLAO|nr:DUF4468 domain-containing protein [Elizabethkingia bruuniana]KGO08575.1 hypothetical protein KS04_18530 [Elizabethkingia miricola]QQN57482.1 DUF4468 domain-containing protein [Elizabethkingia bruuniana]
MNKIFTILALGIFSISTAQFKLTSSNYINEIDPSKNYVVYEFQGLSQKQIFDKVKMYIHSNFKYLKGDGYNEVEPGQIKLITNEDFIARKSLGMTFSYILNTTYELNFKDGKMMIKPYFNYINIPYGVNEQVYLTYNGSSNKSVFKKNGKIWLEDIGFKNAENTVNNFVIGLKESITKNEDW